MININRDSFVSILCQSLKISLYSGAMKKTNEKGLILHIKSIRTTDPHMKLSCEKLPKKYEVSDSDI